MAAVAPNDDAQERRKEMIIESYVRDHILPNAEVDAEDAVTLVRTLVGTGQTASLYLLNPKENFNRVLNHRRITETFTVCKNRNKIVQLQLGCNYDRYKWNALGPMYFAIPKEILALDALEDLTIGGICGQRDVLAEKFATSIRNVFGIRNLKRLKITKIMDGRDDDGDDLMQILLNNLKNANSDETDEHWYCAFKNKLEVLELRHIRLKQDHMAMFIVDIVKRFPCLTTLDISRNKVKSFQPIASRIKDLNASERRILSKSCKLRNLYLHFNTAYKKVINGNQDEALALEVILQTFRRLSRLDEFFARGKPPLPSNLEYLLAINRAGRFLLDKDMGDASVPMSLWPLVLERSYWNPKMFYQGGHWKATKPTGMFHLLRHGPALSIRTGVFHDFDNGVTTDVDGENNNKEKNHPPPPKKRRRNLT